MRGATCAGEDGPAIVVPVDYEMGVAQEADDEGDGKCWDGWRVLNEKPPRGLGFVA